MAGLFCTPVRKPISEKRDKKGALRYPLLDYVSNRASIEVSFLFLSFFFLSANSSRFHRRISIRREKLEFPSGFGTRHTIN